MSSSTSIRVTRVDSRAAAKDFLETPYRVLGQESMWVPMPRSEMRHLLDRKRHPFHEHAQVEYFLAWREGSPLPVGRIAAIENHAHNAFHGERVGFFGMLEAETDPDVFAALLAAAEDWGRARGLTAMRGPCSFSTNEECGLLVDGFDTPPMVMTPWNPEVYPGLVEQAGYAKARDLYSYILTRSSYKPRIERIAEGVVQRFARRGDKLTVRPLNMKDFAAELDRVRAVYNSAWAKNWGFVPMTDAEIGEMARSLRPLVVPDLVQFAELNGQPVAFIICLPDYNVPLRHMEGRTGPREIALFLLMRRRIRQARVMALGVVAEHRNRGIETLIISRVIHNCLNGGIGAAEMGWILDDNDQMNRELIGMGARRYRVHRIYEKLLEPAR